MVEGNRPELGETQRKPLQQRDMFNNGDKHYINNYKCIKDRFNVINVNSLTARTQLHVFLEFSATALIQNEIQTLVEGAALFSQTELSRNGEVSTYVQLKGLNDCDFRHKHTDSD